jgi:hypothetical protein
MLSVNHGHVQELRQQRGLLPLGQQRARRKTRCEVLGITQFFQKLCLDAGRLRSLVGRLRPLKLSS